MTDQLLKATTSLCATCKRSLAAEVWQIDGTVVMRKSCPQHGSQEVLLSSNADWYRSIVAEPAHLEAPLSEQTAIAQGCPFDCGPCQAHEQRLHLPIVPITSACNLDCPICYTHNKNDGAYQMSPDELRLVLKQLQKLAPERRILNITGGEPTQHPQLVELLGMCREHGIERITLSTHGLGFLKDEPLLEALQSLDARVILSFDSFKPHVNQTMLGGPFLKPKLRVLELLERYQLQTTLLPVLARGLNDDEIAAFVELALGRDFIRSVEFHPLAFTGQSGVNFDRQARYTTFDALSDIEAATAGMLRVSDFVPSPVAHSLCYLVSYLLRLQDGRWLPFTRFMSVSELRRLLTGGLYLSPSPEVERAFELVITRLWAHTNTTPDTELILASLKQMLRQIFAPELTERERLAVAERYTKAVYVHTHMDEESFDTDRIRLCPVSIPDANGHTIPSCAYNVLYRERDPRFVPNPRPALITLGRGRLEQAAPRCGQTRCGQTNTQK